MAKAEDVGFDIVPPKPAALIEAMRATGYDFETAVADIVDNSITAEASHVLITVHEEGRRSWIAISDDGNGMSDSRLAEAMALGAVDPTQPRHPDDLGRFGLGLKTASLSQCRRLTVLTKCLRGDVCVRCWDIDIVTKKATWALLKSCPSERLEQRFRTELAERKHGTIVLWEVLDRVIHDAPDADVAVRLQERLPRLERYLGMVFHRFLEEAGGLRISIGGVQVQPWDPFMRGEKATQPLGREVLQYKNSTITVRPYVLPHTSKMTTAAYQSGSGPRSWVDHQGFYLYRNKRLLVPGSWLGLGFGKEDYNKLVRIQVDFGNELDFEWDINVRKSRAIPPDALRHHFIRIGKKAREVAKGIFRHRGALVARNVTEQSYLWERRVHHGKVFYRVNAKHPAVVALLEAASRQGMKKQIGGFLKILEQTVPVPLILIDGYEKPESLGDPGDLKVDAEIKETMLEYHKELCAAGQTAHDAFMSLAATEPFFRHPAVVAVVREQLGIGDEQ